MRVTDEGLKPVELDPGAVGRLSRIDELQNQAMTRNLREREEVKLGSLTDALRRIEKGTYGICYGVRISHSGGSPRGVSRDRDLHGLHGLTARRPSSGTQKGPEDVEIVDYH